MADGHSLACEWFLMPRKALMPFLVAAGENNQYPISHFTVWLASQGEKMGNRVGVGFPVFFLFFFSTGKLNFPRRQMLYKKNKKT